MAGIVSGAVYMPKHIIYSINLSTYRKISVNHRYCSLAHLLCVHKKQGLVNMAGNLTANAVQGAREGNRTLRCARTQISQIPQINTDTNKKSDLIESFF